MIRAICSFVSGSSCCVATTSPREDRSSNVSVQIARVWYGRAFTHRFVRFVFGLDVNFSSHRCKAGSSKILVELITRCGTLKNGSDNNLWKPSHSRFGVFEVPIPWNAKKIFCLIYANKNSELWQKSVRFLRVTRIVHKSFCRKPIRYPHFSSTRQGPRARGNEAVNTQFLIFLYSCSVWLGRYSIPFNAFIWSLSTDGCKRAPGCANVFAVVSTRKTRRGSSANGTNDWRCLGDIQCVFGRSNSCSSGEASLRRSREGVWREKRDGRQKLKSYIDTHGYQYCEYPVPFRWLFYSFWFLFCSFVFYDCV